MPYHIMYCPKCGLISLKFDTLNQNRCIECNVPYNYDVIPVYDTKHLDDYFEAHVRNNPDFDVKRYNRRMEMMKLIEASR